MNKTERADSQRQIWTTCEGRKNAAARAEPIQSKVFNVAVGLSHERLPDMFSNDIPEFLGRTDISTKTKKASCTTTDRFLPAQTLNEERNDSRKVAKLASLETNLFSLRTCASWARNFSSFFLVNIPVTK